MGGLHFERKVSNQFAGCFGMQGLQFLSICLPSPYPASTNLQRAPPAYGTRVLLVLHERRLHAFASLRVPFIWAAGLKRSSLACNDPQEIGLRTCQRLQGPFKKLHQHRAGACGKGSSVCIQVCECNKESICFMLHERFAPFALFISHLRSL